MTWRIFDEDGDGIKTLSEVMKALRAFVFLGLAVYVVVMQAYCQCYSDIQFVSVEALSLGAHVFLEFIQANKIVAKKEVKDPFEEEAL